MYIIHNLISRIKEQAKKKGIKTTVMLEECGINKNMLSTMNTRGSWIQSDGLAKIADYLDCSVDYLLCRTENPNSHKYHASDTVISPEEQQLNDIIKIYNQLDNIGKAKLLIAADEILNKKGSV